MKKPIDINVVPLWFYDCLCLCKKNLPILQPIQFQIKKIATALFLSSGFKFFFISDSEIEYPIWS